MNSGTPGPRTPEKELIIFYGSRSHGKSYLQKMWIDYGKLELKDMTSMPEPKYKFSRAKWYDVHLLFKNYDSIIERVKWCEQHFGPQPKVPDAWCRWYLTHNFIRFRDSKDYEWYMMRWM